MIDSPATATGVWLPAALTAFGGFATAAVSFITLRISDARKDERTYQREKAARLDARRDKIIERRNELQRDTLIELQQVVQKAVRCAGRMHHHDLMENRRGIRWHGSLYPADLDADAHEAAVQMLALSVRVRDHTVRDLVMQLNGELTLIAMCDSEVQADKNTMVALTTFTSINKRVWEVLSTLDDVELADA